MNIYLLQLVGKWFSIAIVMIASIGGSTIKDQTFNISNASKDMNEVVVSKIINHNTIINYNNKLPINTKKVIIVGEDGVIYIDNDTKDEKILHQMVSEVVEIGTGLQGEYTGRMTGYGPDCKGCSTVGNVACRTEAKGKHSLINNSIFYTDDQYGAVRILAAETKVFPCGTIVLVDNGILEPFYGVVLDTGYTMRKAWAADQAVWMDLAFESQASVKNATSRNVNYSVQRWGW